MEPTEINLKSIENKWQKKWQESKIFEPEPIKNKPKFFCTFPYPYVNGYSHLGHLYTIAKMDVFARYKRMKGYNVLFPQAWHCTGSPIVSAAQRVKENEPKQVKILEDMGFSKAEIKKFATPEYWIEYFPKEFEK
ncbi:MAG: class I tRNA ligase family protein, partial [Nanoarchaeota archaeon]|nr:class I tRNA ligase family protein [Nanoarchaeota archaeon]